MSELEVIVSVADEKAGAFAKVVSALRRAGLQVDQEMAELGVVSGRVAAASLPKLERVAGVGHVERSRTVGIAPPVSEIQ